VASKEVVETSILTTTTRGSKSILLMMISQLELTQDLFLSWEMSKRGLRELRRRRRACMPITRELLMTTRLECKTYLSKIPNLHAVEESSIWICTREEKLPRQVEMSSMTTNQSLTTPVMISKMSWDLLTILSLEFKSS
jgi:hypothetical protein